MTITYPLAKPLKTREKVKKKPKISSLFKIKYKSNVSTDHPLENLISAESFRIKNSEEAEEGTE
jgi:hypothetical protein